MSEELHALLRATDLFSALDPPAVARVAEVGRVEHWTKGAVVLEEGAFGPRMMVILQGSVEILRRDGAGVQRAITTLSSGDVLGELSLLLDLPRTATVRAQQEVQLFALDREAFVDLVRVEDPTFLLLGYHLSRTLARRLIALNDRTVSLLAENDELKERFGEARGELFELWDSGEPAGGVEDRGES
ncbi:MAG: cyclic nucleotide-binding domain-containing protein [Myxococcales bacterium]|nr:cyclic nucleotide-binding domain-containing protein [Myxococcales bacterium]